MPFKRRARLACFSDARIGESSARFARKRRIFPTETWVDRDPPRLSHPRKDFFSFLLLPRSSCFLSLPPRSSFSLFGETAFAVNSRDLIAREQMC